MSNDFGYPYHSLAAMNTEFRIYPVHPDPVYAEQAAQAAFGTIGQLEQRMSRFVEGSDLARIGLLDAGESLFVDPDVFEMLQISIELCTATHRAFDIAFRSPHGHSVAESLRLDPERCRVTARRAGTLLDAGGIGKGFALDCAARTLEVWDIGNVLLQALHSTLLALGPPPDARGWRAGFGPPGNRHLLHLAHLGFSGSGTAAQGAHIIDPRSGKPVADRFRAWAEAPTAAEADALSTAFMVMTHAEIEAFIHGHPRVSAYLQGAEDDNAPVAVIR